MDISTDMVKLLLDKLDHMYLQYVVKDAKPFSVSTLIVGTQFQFQS